MKPPPFAYHRPSTRAAVDQLLAELGDDAKVLAGGQSLIPIMNMRLAAPAHLVDINRLEDEPSEPVLDDGVIRFGPLVRQAGAERWPDCPAALAEALAYTAHPAIRTRGTIVGSVAHADPAAELPALMLALSGEVRARSAEGTRTIAAEDFFLGALETALRPGEWVEEVSMRAAPAATAAVEEFAQRHGDYALCGAIAVAGEGRVTLVHFGIGPLPVRTTLTAPVTVDDVREALADVDMTDDLHASSAYRRHLAAVLGARAASRALA